MTPMRLLQNIGGHAEITLLTQKAQARCHKEVTWSATCIGNKISSNVKRLYKTPKINRSKLKHIESETT